MVLGAAQISQNGKSREAVLGEFQKRGLLLTHVLECPLDGGPGDPSYAKDALERHMPAALGRIRWSLKPKRIIVISEELYPFLERLREVDPGCAVDSL